MHEQAQFSQTIEGHSVVLTVSGELDIVNADQFKVALAQGLAAARDKFVVDLHRLSYLDSTGIARLIQVLRDAEAGGKSLSLIIDGNGHLQKLFDITGLSQLCPVKHVEHR